MIFLVSAVLCSVAVSVLLKMLRLRQIDIRQTILAGYPVAFLLTLILLRPQLNEITQLPTTSWAIVLALGLLLPSVFVILGRAIESVGIIATDAAQRLSLILPIVAAFMLFGETLTAQRAIGIALGFMALGALAYRSSGASAAASVTNQPTADAYSSDRQASIRKVPVIVWLASVWVGYGVIDILFKQVAKQGTSFPLTLFLSFGLATVLLLVYLLSRGIRWQPSALVAGLLLGVLNMGNIYAYIRAHQALSDSPSIVFTGMNVGVIAVATLIGVVVFREQLSKVNILGLLLAVCCVAVLFLA